jgi:predicted nuclease of predicted toxin-antitoxin system
MKIKLDENLPVESKRDLAEAGHDVRTVHDQGLTGAADETLVPLLAAEGRLLVTMDKGIADIRRFPPEKTAGLILLRPRQTGRLAVRRFIQHHIAPLELDGFRGRLLVVTDDGMRLR